MRLSLKRGKNKNLVANRYNLNKLLDQTRKEYQTDVTNKLSALDILSVGNTWVIIKNSIKASAEE